MRYATERQVLFELRRRAARIESLSRSDEALGLSSVLTREGIAADAMRFARFGGVIVRGCLLPARTGGAYGVAS